MSNDFKIGLLGFGTVGQGVYEIINIKRKDYFSSLGVSVKSIMVRSLNKPGRVAPEFAELTDSIDAILNDDDIKLVCAVLGAGDTEYEYIKRALCAGKHVVTANKEVVSKYISELISLAEEHNVRFMFEAAVGGGIPIISSIIDTIAINNISRIQGILNGTTNYILTKMTKEKRGFDEVLKQAQALGFAEADPSADIEGYDVARKITILSSIAFRTLIKEEDIHLRGISNITSDDIQMASDFGYNIKFIGQGLNGEGGYGVSVTPVLVAKDSVVSNVNEEYNVIVIEGDIIGKLCFMGKGAGKSATADAMASDIIKVVSGDARYKALSFDQERESKGIEGLSNEYYLRVNISGYAEFESAVDIIKEQIKKNRITYHAGKLFVLTETVASCQMKTLCENLKNAGCEVFYARIEKELI